MITIFDILKDINTHKRDIVSRSFEAESVFQPYLVQRWLSMQDSQTVILLNHTTNLLWRSCDNVKDWSKLFISVIPKNRCGRTSYIKKAKKPPKSEDTDTAKIIAEYLEISVREAQEYIMNESIDVKKIKQEFNI